MPVALDGSPHNELLAALALLTLNQVPIRVGLNPVVFVLFDIMVQVLPSNHLYHNVSMYNVLSPNISNICGNCKHFAFKHFAAAP